MRLFLLLLLSLLAPPALGVETLDLPPRGAATLGVNRATRVQPRETLMELALREGVGFQNLVAANPGYDPWQPPAGAQVLLPTAANAPAGLGAGITINLAEFRLYYLWSENGRRKARIYPVGIGSEGWNTPEGEFTIIDKVERPAWVVPPSIRQEKPELPAVVPPGPENPLGEYWLQLSVHGYGIHGTNRPLGVGRRISHGCIRMYPEDIRDLYGRVEKGTPVRIVYEPIKLTRDGKTLLLEAHADFLGKIADPLREVVRQKRALHWSGPLHLRTVEKVLRAATGVPTPLLLNQPQQGKTADVPRQE